MLHFSYHFTTAMAVVVVPELKSSLRVPFEVNSRRVPVSVPDSWTRGVSAALRSESGQQCAFYDFRLWLKLEHSAWIVRLRSSFQVYGLRPSRQGSRFTKAFAPLNLQDFWLWVLWSERELELDIRNCRQRLRSESRIKQEPTNPWQRQQGKARAKVMLKLGSAWQACLLIWHLIPIKEVRKKQKGKKM